MNITIVTGNANKFAEAKQIVPELEQADIDLDEIQSIDPKVIIEHKLSEARKKLTGKIMVEDGSLTLECMNGLPGPLIKWFMKTIGNDGLVKIVKAYGNAKAVASVIVGLSNEDGTVEYFDGVIEGEIVEPRGENGFGWDPIFQPKGWTKTFAEMTMEEKNEISMRRIAFQKLKEYLG